MIFNEGVRSLACRSKSAQKKCNQESMRDMHTGTSICQADIPYLTSACPKDIMK